MKWLWEYRSHAVIGRLESKGKNVDGVTQTRQPDLEGCHMLRRAPLIAFSTFPPFRPPDPQSAHLRQRHASQAMYDEIIPDSEPEREAIRRGLDEERRTKRTRKRPAPEKTRSMSLVLSSSPEPDLSTSFNPFPPFIG